MTNIKYWNFHVPGPDPEHKWYGAGTVVISESGFFAATTDFGNAIFHWGYGKPYPDFRKTFLSFGREYLLEKLYCLQKEFRPTKEDFDWLRTRLHEAYPQERDESGRFKRRHTELEHELDLLELLEGQPELPNFYWWWDQSYFFRNDSELGDYFYHYTSQQEAFVDDFVPRLKQVIRDALLDEVRTLDLCI